MPRPWTPSLRSSPRVAAVPSDPASPETTTVKSVVMVPGVAEGYREVAVETRFAPPTDRVHISSATCVDLIAAGKTAYALFTIPPPDIKQSENGDRLQMAAPLCTEISKGGSRSRRTIVLTKTGAADTDWPRPQPQYAVVGELLSQEQLASHAATAMVERGCEYCPRMVRIPEGHFVMGSNADPNKSPIHGVNVLPFFLSQFPVTVGEWRRCVVAKACSGEPIRDAGVDDAPVHNLSWDDAQQYVAWLSLVTEKPYRLPTEAEWEFAARANTTSVYWWGDQLADDRANCRECGLPFAADAPAPVGTFAANQFGLFDMAGGVDQWVADCWHQDYQQAPSDGSVWGTANCQERVLRGGSWKDDRGRLTVAGRNHDEAHARDARYGFRVARSAAPAKITDAAPRQDAAVTTSPPPVRPAAPALVVPPVLDAEAAAATRFPVSLGGRPEDLAPGTVVRVKGLAGGITLSGGQANAGRGWVVPLWALDDLKIRVPPDMSGTLDLDIALVDNDGAAPGRAQRCTSRQAQGRHSTE